LRCDLLVTNNNNNMNAETKKAYEENKQNIIAALRAAGVKECTINYSGSGDSGQVEEPDFGAGVVVDDVKIEQRNIVTDYDFSGTTYARTYKVSEPKTVGLREAIVDLCYAKLEEKHDGWEINDGSQGSFVINMEEGTIEWRHETNYTEVETDGETF
jgi:hypothetical protein